MLQMAACIVIICGLPGSGKTTICRTFCENTNTLHFASTDKIRYIHICYDQLFPDDGGEKSLLTLSDSVEKDSKWKSYRQFISACVRLLFLSNIPSQEQFPFEELLKSVPQELVLKFIKLVHNKDVEAKEVSSWSDKMWSSALKWPWNDKTVIVIDDNMYYKSMRYEIYQIARMFSTGFCQIYIKCDLNLAKERNQSREVHVPDHVIENMAKKFEEPDRQETWQRHILVVKNETDCDVNGLTLCFSTLVNEAITDPESPVCDDQAFEKEREESRTVCSVSALHQIDQILRKLISYHMKTVDRAEVSMRDFACKLNEIKGNLLEGFKHGALEFDLKMAEHTENASKDTNNPVYVYVEKLFQDRLSSI